MHCIGFAGIWLQVRDVDGKWQAVRIPNSVKALVLLNLQSYGGGRDIWGLADSNKDTSRGWKTPIFNDGMFEVMSCGLLDSCMVCTWCQHDVVS